MRKSHHTVMNIFASIVVLIVNMAISFWLSPFIVENVGVEAQGFIGLSNSMITYAGIIVTALNAMAARFITICYAKKDYGKANLYYNSVFWGNLWIVAILIPVAIGVLIFFDRIFDVPTEILKDVRVLLVLVFGYFFVATAAPNYDVGCYASNRLDRTLIPDAVFQLFRAFILIMLFKMFEPHIWYVGATSMLVVCGMLLVNKYNTKKLTPELTIKIRGERICSVSAIKELIGAGMWSSISNMGNMFLSGLDLVVCNTLLGAASMGVLAVSKILANVLQQFSGALTRAFAPELTIDFANGNKSRMYYNLNRSMKLTACFMTVATAGMLVFGERFFSLWIPSQDAKVLSVLSGVSFLGYFFTSGTQILYNVFNVTNHVKAGAIAQITSGVVSIVLTVVLVKYTSIGIYAVAGVSTICNFTRNMLFTLPATAEYLGLKKTTFYPMVAKSLLSTSIICVLAKGVTLVIRMDCWLMFIMGVTIVAIVGVSINMFLVLSKDERDYIFRKILGIVRVSRGKYDV